MIEKQKEDSFINIIDKTTDVSLEALSQVLEKKTDLDNSESQKIVDTISSTIEVIAENFDDLQQSKAQGTSRTEWLKEKLDDTIHKHHIAHTEEFIGEIKDSLKESNIQIGREVFGTEIDISKPLKSEQYKDLNKTAIVNDFQEEIKTNTLLGAVIFEQGKISVDETHKEIKAVKEYFFTKLDAPQDKQFKKAISTATVIAQKNQLLPKQLSDKTPAEISIIVDKGVTAAKVAYKVAQGDLSPIDAVEYTIDRNVAILNTIITETTTRIGGEVGTKVGATLGSVFGPVGTIIGAKIGRQVGKVGGYAVGQMIEKGVKTVASAVKSVASSAWSGVKSVCSSVGSWVSSWF